MIDSNQEVVVNDIVNNFMTVLSILTTKTLIEMNKGTLKEDFDLLANIDDAVAQWKNEVKGIIQQRVNETYKFQSKIAESPQGDLINHIFGAVDVEDFQQESNKIFKTACKRVDDLVALLKLHE